MWVWSSKLGGTWQLCCLISSFMNPIITILFAQCKLRCTSPEYMKLLNSWESKVFWGYFHFKNSLEDFTFRKSLSSGVVINSVTILCFFLSEVFLKLKEPEHLTTAKFLPHGMVSAHWIQKMLFTPKYSCSVRIVNRNYRDMSSYIWFGCN
jgi:hypothetical protein